MGFVYAFQIGDDGPIKIGYTSDVAARKKLLEEISPWTFFTLFAVPGTRENETWVHTRLRGHRMRGEWFHSCVPVRELISKITSADWEWPNSRRPARVAPNKDNFIAQEMRALAEGALASIITPGQKICNQLALLARHLAISPWRVKAAWYCEAGCWSAAAVEEFRTGCLRLIEARSREAA